MIVTPSEEPLAQAKPPFLRRVRIRGYKSIAFCDVTLEPLTILVGRNASGKSNFVDALAFIRDAMASGVAEALKRRGGIRGVMCRTVPSEPVELEVESMLVAGRRAKKEYQFRYHVRLQPGEGADFEIPHEQLTITDIESGTKSGYHTEGDRAILFGPGEDNSGSPYNPAPNLFLARDVRDPDWDFATALRYMGFYNFQPEQIRKLRQPSGEWLLERDGSNIASAISSIQSHDLDALERVRRYFKAITSSVELADVVRYGEYETVQFRVQHPVSVPSITFDAVNMSDGTLRALAALVAAFQHVGKFGHAALVAIEEPETALHPAAMRALVAALDEATLRTQILLTTHSPDLLDAAEIKPENVRVVQMIDGKTVIGPVDEAGVEIVARQLNSLGGLERENQLEADLDDQDRQQELAGRRQEDRL